MAARTPVEILRDEARCSICLEIFQDPVSIHCGHSFCQSCITETWEGLTTNFSCPQCWKTLSRKTLRPNRELATMIEAAKRLNLQPNREVGGGENLCKEHQEPLKLFCQDDKRLICLVCDRSKDIGTTLIRGQRETLSHSLDISPELEQKFSDFTEKNPDIKELLEKLQDVLVLELPLTTQMTLDPETANDGLYLSEDCKLVHWEGRGQGLPSNPERFKSGPFVLGSRSFTSGWHLWDVEICGVGMWAIGVAKNCQIRRFSSSMQLEPVIWALYHNSGRYEALTSRNVTPLTLCSVPKRIRICLDCEEGRLVFFDAESKKQIFAMLQASFQGERVFPWFMVRGKARLRLLP
ncbi:E3 ubiquitin-protein ligase TRIM39-like [Numenius arquata]|uniref:E3 ubiquitin-protein ligase TRIM39-like n=1 Tax=Numenius arquata TaxID=31919 RepID=UPI003D30469C